MNSLDFNIKNYSVDLDLLKLVGKIALVALSGLAITLAGLAVGAIAGAVILGSAGAILGASVTVINCSIPSGLLFIFMLTGNVTTYAAVAGVVGGAVGGMVGGTIGNIIGGAMSAKYAVKKFSQFKFCNLSKHSMRQTKAEYSEPYNFLYQGFDRPLTPLFSHS